MSASAAPQPLVTVAVEKRDKPRLDRLKVHDREPNHEVFHDILTFYYEAHGPRIKREAPT